MSEPVPEKAVTPEEKKLRTDLAKPLVFLIAFNCISLLTMPFQAEVIQQATFSSLQQAGMEEAARSITPEMMRSTMWFTMVIMIIGTVFMELTRQATLQGKSWAWTGGLLTAIVSVINFPIATVGGIWLLVQLFKSEVREHFGR